MTVLISHRTDDADPSLPGLEADDHSFGQIVFFGMHGPPFDDVLDANGNVVRGRDHDLADLTDAAALFGAQVTGGGRRIGHVHRVDHGVFAATDEADPAHDLDAAPLHDEISAGVGVAVFDGVFELRERDAEFLEALRIGLNFVTLDGAAVAHDADHAGHPQELPLEGPVLQRFENVQRVDFLTEGVFGAVQRVAVDFADGRSRGDPRLDRFGKFGHGQAVEHFLPR